MMVDVVDIAKEYGPEGWRPITDKLKKDKHPSPKDLADRLRGTQPIPQEVRNYIAGRLDGSIRAPRGPKGGSFRMTWNHVWAQMMVATEEENIRKLPPEDPERRNVRDSALDRVSETMDTPASTIKKWLYPKKK